MKKILTNLSLNNKLALLAFILGFLALFAGNPYHGTEATLNAKELALIVEKEVDHVDVRALADWIIQGKSDYRLIDLRSEKEFGEYHIPTSEQISVAGLESASLLRSEKIILYSEGGIHSAQAWMLLRAKGYKAVYMLRGGLEEWKDQILFPRIPENATPELLADFNKAKEVSKYFGGTPQTGAADQKGTPSLTMPKLEMPPAGASPASGGPKKKKKEGC